eukprot:880938-Pyramimonas_sp.AAC.1
MRKPARAPGQGRRTLGPRSLPRSRPGADRNELVDWRWVGRDKTDWIGPPQARQQMNRRAGLDGLDW